MLGFLDTFDAVTFPTSAIFFGVVVCFFFVEKNARCTRPLLLDDEDGVAAAVSLHPPVRKVVVDAFCAAENMVDDDAMMKKWETGVSREKKRKNPLNLKEYYWV